MSVFTNLNQKDSSGFAPCSEPRLTYSTVSYVCLYSAAILLPVNENSVTWLNNEATRSVVYVLLYEIVPPNCKQRNLFFKQQLPEHVNFYY